MLRKILLSLLVTLISVLAVLGGAYHLQKYYNETYIHLEDGIYRRDSVFLDFSGKPFGVTVLDNFPSLSEVNLRGTGMTPEDYDRLRGERPGLSIAWDVPFQEGVLPNDTREIRLDHLSREDFDVFPYFSRLERIDADGISDYALLESLRDVLPDCKVDYRVRIGDTAWQTDTTFLNIPDVTPDEVAELLPFLPRVEKVYLTGSMAHPADMVALCRDYPSIAFSWESAGIRFGLDTELKSAEFSGIPLTFEEIAPLLACFPDLEYAGMLGCGLTDEEMIELCRRSPGCFFLWEMDFLGHTVRTDIEELYLSGTSVDLEKLESLLVYTPNLRLIDMCGCGISTPEMAELSERHPDIRFIWEVQLGSFTVRTDAKWFAPVTRGEKVESWQLEDLRYCVDMICIDLGHQKVYDCEWAAYMPNLQYLVLADTPLKSIEPLRGLTNLIYCELFLTSIRDVSPLTTCTALEDLNLCYDYLDPTPIKEMTWLKRLWWSGNYWAKVTLTPVLTETEMNFDSPSSTGGEWRHGKRYYEMRDIIGMYYMEG